MAFNPYASNPYVSYNPYTVNNTAPQFYQQPQAQQYQPQPQPQQMPQAQPQPAQSGNGILWVQGEAGAKSYLVGAGQSVMLMDSESSTFYIKSVDVSGMPNPIRIFDYVERSENTPTAAAAQQAQAQAQEVPYATKDQVQALYRRIEELESLLYAPQQQAPQPQQQPQENSK